ncbi:DUF6114 domain-containing protein [Galbitalea sp. SE-J8]|uniref:DUF6114 domain-containing protein n=1 Tax=Galbitalea sp. SE-J8 TaxID=3054952 RepID=UPI00259CB50E|nr:DUF6114 domain-containing protein [Galbitalea sp. SE-J8]MDM4761736.1 DUF6114 domain-containing protein [Galbitalea sp. SE-J8]
MTAQSTAGARPGARIRFREFRRTRPFPGGLLAVLAGVEMFLSSQLDLKNIRFQVGVEGLQATIIPVLLIVLGVLVVATPAHRLLYGVLILVVAVYSLIGANLGGFVAGFLLGAIGGVLVVAWLPRHERVRRHGRDRRMPRARRSAAPGALSPAPGPSAPASGPSSPAAATDPSGAGAAHAEYVRTVGAVDRTGPPDPDPDGASGAQRGRAARAGAGLAVVLAASLAATGIAGLDPPAADAAQPDLCIPVLMSCGTPNPTPTPSPTATTGAPGAGDPGAGDPGTVDPGTGDAGAGDVDAGSAVPGGTDPGAIVPGGIDPGGTVPTVPGTTSGPGSSSTGSSSTGPADDETPLDPSDALLDRSAPVVTLPAAQLGGSSISFTGIPTLAYVKLRLANGGTTTALRLTASSITITGFYLDVKGEQGGVSLVTVDDTMVLRGRVAAYLDSGTVTLGDGSELQLGTDTPTVEHELPAEAMRVTLGLIAVTADDITHTRTRQQIHEAGR